MQVQRPPRPLMGSNLLPLLAKSGTSPLHFSEQLFILNRLKQITHSPVLNGLPGVFKLAKSRQQHTAGPWIMLMHMLA
ncbi:hypothetical protein D3C76_550590 [compost metagenome]